ncbi:hepatitis A virus cellular receptor 2 [Suricata suricatta]|uniref:hepatitis A virus cellular receptor 2 n=1 Tax=Suricata suricatta TaxID=37032 RepID=UPI0011560B0D|nr:hepatitis A virus cellular receptor 2 [Suricata suricatta]
MVSQRSFDCVLLLLPLLTRSCPVFECYSTLLSTDGRNLKYQTSDRYQLKRNFRKGDVSLTIENVTLDDSGTYCCRIQFPGLMNDKKLNLELVIKPAKVTPARPTRRDFTTAFPRNLTTKGYGSETQTLEPLHDKNQTFHSLVTMANIPPSGLANIAAEGMRSEENIYIIEENIYETEDPYEYYCYVSKEELS